MAGVGKLLPIKSVRDMAASLRSGFDISALNKLVMESLQQSPQMRMTQQFPHRAIFLEEISKQDMQKQLNKLLERLGEYYCFLLVKDRAKIKCDKYAAFQIHWLERIQAIVSYGECHATDEGQVDHEGFTKEELAIADDMTNIILQAFDGLPENNDILVLFQTIARQVFHYQQSRILSIKQGTDHDNVDDDRYQLAIESDNDDVLLRVCGAQMHRMISVCKEQLKRKDRTPTSKAIIQKELDFLAQISMVTSQKEFLPASLMSTELGGRTFPLMELIPFIKQIVHSVRQEINEDSFKRYGEQLFQVRQPNTPIPMPTLLCVLTQVTEIKLKCDKVLLELFYTCWGKDVGSEVDEDIVESCIGELVTKIVNLCKKDWEVSRKKLEAYKGNDVTLNLRDILKAYIAK